MALEEHLRAHCVGYRGTMQWHIQKLYFAVWRLSKLCIEYML